MPIVLDETTRAAYLAESLASSRSALVVSALTGTVSVEVRDGSDVLRASGTMAAPWATSSGATITVGQVTGAGITVSSGGVPDANWYCQFKAGTRFVRGTFGVSTSSADFRWSLATFQTGSRGTLASVALTATGDSASANPALIPYVMENVVQDAYLGEPYSQLLTITGRWLYDDPTNVPTVSVVGGALPAGLTIDNTLVNLGYASAVRVSGTATVVTTSSVSVKAENSAGSTTKTIQIKTRAYNANRVNPSDMKWKGSFRLTRYSPADDDITAVGYAARGFGMCLSADRTRLFFCAGKSIAEYSIPALTKASTASGLNSAAIVQPFTYALGSFTQDQLQNAPGFVGDPGYAFTGLALFGSDLLISGYYYYDNNGQMRYQVMRRPANLSLSAPIISTQIGDSLSDIRFWTGGIEKIPASFASANGLPPYAIGRFGGSIDSSLSRGPTVGAFDPSLLTDKGLVPVTKLSAYPFADSVTGRESLSYVNGYPTLGNKTVNAQNKWYTAGHTSMYGMAWAEAKASVLFIGYIGIGSPWYDNVSGDNTDNAFPPFAVQDRTMSHGNHCAPYQQYVWAVDPAELAAVKAGSKQPNEVNVYDVWPLPPTPYTSNHPEVPWLGGVAHDPVARLIYVAQPARDPISYYVKWPVIDVYEY